MQALQDLPDDNDVLKQFKSNMRNSFERRFPVTDIDVCAAMLDPSQRHLQTIDEYIQGKNTTAVKFLTTMIEKYVTPARMDQLDRQEEAVHAGAASQASSAECSTSQSSMTPAWKKARLELIAKHSRADQSNLQKELQQYRCLSHASFDDILHWWKQQLDTFPNLAKLAQGILAVPATSAPSERVFSIAGLVLQAKRSALAPHRVDKIIFVHNNYTFVDQFNI
jgi:hypothetical protein